MGGKKKASKQPDVNVPAGDAKMGKAIFNDLCGACHAISGDSKSAAAPALGGIIGTVCGERTNFPYSKAMKGSGITWSEKYLFAYLANPGKTIPGNKMAFGGIADETERANLIAYLKSTSA